MNTYVYRLHLYVCFLLHVDRDVFLIIRAGLHHVHVLVLAGHEPTATHVARYLTVSENTHANYENGLNVEWNPRTGTMWRIRG